SATSTSNRSRAKWAISSRIGFASVSRISSSRNARRRSVSLAGIGMVDITHPRSGSTPVTIAGCRQIASTTQLFFPMFTAAGDIPIIAANGDLITGGNRITVSVDTQVHGGFTAAVTNGFHLSEFIGHAQQYFAAGKRVAKGIGANAIAHDRNADAVNDIGELPNLLFG